MFIEKRNTYTIITYGHSDLISLFPPKDFSGDFDSTQGVEIGPDEERFFGMRPYLRQRDDLYVMDYYFVAVNPIAKGEVIRFIQGQEKCFEPEEEKIFFSWVNGSSPVQPISINFIYDVQEQLPWLNISGYFSHYGEEGMFLYHAYLAFGCPNQTKGILARAGLIRLARELDHYSWISRFGPSAEDIFDLPLLMLRVLEASDKRIRDTVLVSREKCNQVKKKIDTFASLYPELTGTTLLYYFVLEEVMAEVVDEKRFSSLLPPYIEPEKEPEYISLYYPMVGFCFDRAPVVLDIGEDKRGTMRELAEQGYFLVDEAYHYMPRRDYDRMRKRMGSDMARREEVVIRGCEVIPRTTVFHNGVCIEPSTDRMLYQRIQDYNTPGVHVVLNRDPDFLYRYRDSEFDAESLYVSEEALVTALVYSVQTMGEGKIGCPELSEEKKRIVIYDLDVLEYGRKSTHEEIAKISFQWWKEHPELQIYLLTANGAQVALFEMLGINRLPDEDE